MALTFNKEVLGDGIHFTSITDTRFKTNFMAVYLITELAADTAAANAVIPLALSKSSADYQSVTEINKKLSELYGASLNGDVAKLGDSQAVVLTATCIADAYTLGGEKITGELTDVLLGCLLAPNIEGDSFVTKNFELNKQELLDDIDAEINEKRSYAMIRAGKTIYRGEPASITAHGDKEHAEALTAKLAYAQYQTLLRKARIEIFFVGGGDPQDAKVRFAEKFRTLERDYKAVYTSLKSPLKSSPEDVVETLDIAQSKMVMAFKSNYTNTPAIKLMNAIFGQTPFSKLFLNVREKLSLCYYCAAMYDERKGILMVDSGVEKENIQKARAEILNQLNEVAGGNFTEEEMANSVLSLINGFRAVNDSPYSIATWYLRQAYNGTEFTPEQEIERIRAVTREDVIEAAKSLALDTVYVLTKKGGDQ